MIFLASGRLLREYFKTRSRQNCLDPSGFAIGLDALRVSPSGPPPLGLDVDGVEVVDSLKERVILAQRQKLRMHRH